MRKLSYNLYKEIVIWYADIKKILNMMHRGLKAGAIAHIKPIIVPENQILEFKDLMQNVLDKLGQKQIYVKDTAIGLIIAQKVKDILITDDIKSRNKDMRELILLFIDKLKTVMKKHGRYAFVILIEENSEKFLLLGHSEFEKTSTIDKKKLGDEIKIVEQFLGPSALYRAVKFIYDKNKNDIAFTYFEKSKSDSFKEFLGISDVESYESGNIRIRVDFFNETDVDFNFTFEQFRQILENKRNIKIDVDQEMLIYYLSDMSYWQFKIREIMLGGRKKFRSVKEFIEVFRKIIEGVEDVVALYNQILHEYVPYVSEMIEYENKIHLRKIREEYKDMLPTYINKPSITYLPIFATRKKNRELIKIDKTFSRYLAEGFLRGNNINIFHAGIEYSYTPCVILNLRIFNNLSIDGAILSVVNDLIRYIRDSRSKILTMILKIAILKLLAISLSDPLKYVFEEVFYQSINVFLENINAADTSLLDKESISDKSVFDVKRIDILKAEPPSHLELLTYRYSRESINIFHECIEQKPPNLWNLTIIGFDEEAWVFKGTGSIKIEDISRWEKEVKAICLEKDVSGLEIIILPIPIRYGDSILWSIGVITLNLKGIRMPPLDMFFGKQ